MKDRISKKIELLKGSYLKYEQSIKAKQAELNRLNSEQQRISDQIDVLEEILSA